MLQFPGNWYRFDQYSGGVMPETCVETYHCSTISPIWMNGTHPTGKFTRLFTLTPERSCLTMIGNPHFWYLINYLHFDNKKGERLNIYKVD